MIQAKHATDGDVWTLKDHENFKLLKRAAAITYPDYGPWAYDEWKRYNEQFFYGRLKPIAIVWGLTPHGSKLGLYSPVPEQITLHKSLIRPKERAWNLHPLFGEHFVSDVLLHEMIHQAQRAFYSPDEYIGPNKSSESSHNNPSWVAEVNRIAPMLGLPANAAVVKQRRIDGKPKWMPPPGCMSQRQLASWPHSAKPRDYYEQDALDMFWDKITKNGNGL